MENQIDPRFGTRDGVMADVVFPDVPVQLIAGTDIGASRPWPSLTLSAPLSTWARRSNWRATYVHVDTVFLKRLYVGR